MRVSLILPTYNEASNVTEVLDRVYKILDPFEVIIVDDDSPDETWRIAEGLRARHPSLKVLRRIGRKGLSSAVTEGFAMAGGDALIVMDADLQHDVSLLPRLAQEIERGADLAIASRYTEGGDTKDWRWIRLFISRAATHLVHAFIPRGVTDPMSGFFAIRRSLYLSVASKLRPRGFKILFEILSFLPRGMRVAEVPFHFGLREQGESKLTLLVHMQFISQLLRIALRRLQYALFIIIAAILGLVLAWHAWNLRLLYASSAARSSVQTSMQALADRNGWLLSAMEIRAVFPDHVRLVHHEYRRGVDPEECLDVFFDSDYVTPCAD